MVIKIIGVIVLILILAIGLIEAGFFRYAIYRSGVKVPDDEHMYTGSWKKYEKVIRDGTSWVNKQNPEQLRFLW